jgi:hypothetical protein
MDRPDDRDVDPLFSTPALHRWIRVMILNDWDDGLVFLRGRGAFEADHS